MAKAKTCAYHLCNAPIESGADPRTRYCRIQCKRNARQWRWRHKKPQKRAKQQHRWWMRKQAKNVKTTYAQRRRPLATRVEKKAAEDRGNSSADPIV
jgi:hypothetical protein